MSPRMFQAMRAVVVAALAALAEVLVRSFDRMNDDS
jgi:hypothetical protein